MMEKIKAEYKFKVTEETPESFMAAVVSNKDQEHFEAISGHVSPDFEFTIKDKERTLEITK